MFKGLNQEPGDKRMFLRVLINIMAIFKIHLFILSFLAALSLRCCARAFSSCGKRGLLYDAVCGLLMAVASLVAGHGH